MGHGNGGCYKKWKILSISMSVGGWKEKARMESPATDSEAFEISETVYLLWSAQLTKMEGVQDELEIKFRLTDGSDIGPKTFPVATSVATLKESVLTQWPKESMDGPRTVKDVKIISAGKILENHRTIGECKSPLYDVTGGVTTMHVIVQPRTLSGRDPKAENSRNQCKCGCVIL